MVSTHKLIQSLPAGPLDVVGDVHGELDALTSLIKNLGYDSSGNHPENRKLVFVGDLCDRGPDSVGVILLVQKLMSTGKAVAILGNHELNLLREDAKDGSGWFFDERVKQDQRYMPFARPSDQERLEIKGFLEQLPIALEREDLRVIHAAWQHKEIEIIRGLKGVFAHHVYGYFQTKLDLALRSDGRHQRYLAVKEQWKDHLEDESNDIPFLNDIAQYDVACQAGNPIKVLTSGVERTGTKPFFSSHKWRFVDRIQWWDEYEDDIPVIIGHYWRMATPIDRKSVGKGDPYLFHDTEPHTWHGLRKNVFCVDYSVGGRWRERTNGRPIGESFRLAAMRWPEGVVVFDTGEMLQTAALK